MLLNCCVAALLAAWLVATHHARAKDAAHNGPSIHQGAQSSRFDNFSSLYFLFIIFLQFILFIFHV